MLVDFLPFFLHGYLQFHKIEKEKVGGGDGDSSFLFSLLARKVRNLNEDRDNR